MATDIQSSEVSAQCGPLLELFDATDQAKDTENCNAASILLQSHTKLKEESEIVEDDPKCDFANSHEKIKDEVLCSQSLLKKEAKYDPRSKRRKPGEKGTDLYEKYLPKASYYEISYMHKDTVTHVKFSRTGYILTASCDGYFKFWKKCDAKGLELVKSYRSHLDAITDVAVTESGDLCATISTDKTMKIYYVPGFDMINMIRLPMAPFRCCWIFAKNDVQKIIAVSDNESGKIYIFDIAADSSDPLHILDKLHSDRITSIVYNPIFNVVVSADESGMIEYWSGIENNFAFPSTAAVPSIKWSYKTDTDFYCLLQHKTHVTSIQCSPDGKWLATLNSDRKVRIFRFSTGKLKKIIDEFTEQYMTLNQKKSLISSMELGRRLALEKEIDRSDVRYLANIVFDDSGNYLCLGTAMGIKIINLSTMKIVARLGILENIRVMQMALQPRFCYATGVVYSAAATVTGAPLMSEEISLTPDMAASSNARLEAERGRLSDCMIVCSAFKKNRFYIFTDKEPNMNTESESLQASEVRDDRDVLNEKPSKDEILAACRPTDSVTKFGGIEQSGEDVASIAGTAVIHTTLGDIHVKLFPDLCPKAVRNFVGHSRNGFFNGLLFHRVIKGFMVQTGCPLGNGTGGSSIWGGEFEDEFHSSLRHDKPFVVSMANCGPNTNGSQFFITVSACPWLDNKHTVFGKVFSGMEVVQKISNVKTNAKNDKPFEDVSVVSISLRDLD